MTTHSIVLGGGYGGEVFVHCTGCTDMDYYDDVETIPAAHAVFNDHLARRFHRRRALSQCTCRTQTGDHAVSCPFPESERRRVAEIERTDPHRANTLRRAGIGR